ncbi:MAG TPA: FKBP-type peptidyl-prolyl cis-trans isomerase, partial [Candidatus Saccharimonadales bacterium]|nr:FKBP-type peptidyl-prolyl cis-trans isomerase [Candidatus Saccharimonadales bacterium]
MASKSQRIIAGGIAGLFLFTSSALTIAVIWQAVQDKNKKPDNGATSTPAATNEKDKNMLQGTKLANFTPGTPIAQLKAEDTTPGTGKAAKAGDNVTVDYTGAVAATGVIFQSSKDTGQPATLSLSSV